MTLWDMKEERIDMHHRCPQIWYALLPLMSWLFSRSIQLYQTTPCRYNSLLPLFIGLAIIFCLILYILVIRGIKSNHKNSNKGGSSFLLSFSRIIDYCPERNITDRILQLKMSYKATATSQRYSRRDIMKYRMLMKK